MKEKTKAFYKAVFKYWLKKSVIPFVAAIVLYFITGFVCYAINGDMGQIALFILTWEYVKRCFRESEGLHERKTTKKEI